MINLSRFNQKYEEFTDTPDAINFKDVIKEAEKSVKDVQESAGTWDTLNINDNLFVMLKKMFSGKEDSVSIPPTGNTWHTHPKSCNSNNDCSIIPPSAQDLKLFASRPRDQHMVITENRVYWVKSNEEYTSDQCEEIYNFYIVLENFFDESDVSHNVYDKLFKYASEYGNFFTIYVFEYNDDMLNYM
tara:strand:+ start:1255 stop:1815 length:561 start_codon:yes stop_codon:yes gene_type:complete